MQVHVIWVAWDGLDLVGALVQKNRPFWIEGLWSKLELINDSFLYYLYFKFRGEGSQIFWICFVGLSGKVPCDEVHGVTKDSLSISIRHLNS